ncbi:MAG: nitrite reductase/ring-hydroxylating ferredoxin subunit [Planctomycetota bacterium]|jgi:nitrite reductase/ring-hydroxylating ferredoxin subunit
MSREETEFDTGVTPAQVDPERPRPFDTPWGSFALYTVESRLVAAQSFCPHMLGPLLEGSLSGDEIVCPWHTWRFSLTTGVCTDCPNGEQPAGLQFCALHIGPAGTLVMGPPSSTPASLDAS